MNVENEMERNKFTCAARGCDGCTVCMPRDNSKLEVNQCDGCNAGVYKDVQGMHRDENSKPIMVCQEYKYT